MSATAPNRAVLRILLFVSVCFNVFAAAYLATQHFGPGPVAISASQAPPALISRVAALLHEPDAAILWQAYGRREAEISAAQADYRTALLAAAAHMPQPQVDAAALRLAVKEARDRRLAVGDLTIEVFLEAFPKLSAKGRQDLLSRLIRN